MQAQKTIREMAVPADKNNTKPVATQAEVMQQILSNPSDAVEIATQLPAIQRARIAQFCYGRVHMRELGLRLASTCDLMTLKAAFGRGGEVVFQQSRDVEKTLGSLKASTSSASPKPITLKGKITG